jgi:RNase P/RNase MRP subunit p29
MKEEPSMKRLVILAATTLALCGGSLPASPAPWLRAEDESVLVGKRLRLTMRSGARHSEPVMGTVVAETERTLRMDTGALNNVVVLRNDIANVEISRAPSRKGHGAAIGFLVGAVAGAGLGYALGDDSQGAPFCTFDGCATLGPFGPTRAEGALLLGALFGGLGAGLGALRAPGERWEPMPVGTAQVRASVIPLRGGVGARLSLSF